MTPDETAPPEPDGVPTGSSAVGSPELEPEFAEAALPAPSDRPAPGETPDLSGEDGPHKFNPFLNEGDMFKILLYVGAAVLAIAIIVGVVRGLL